MCSSEPGNGPHSQILHATTVAIAEHAALICGASGSGKSGLALQLMALGAHLVADDRTKLWRDGDRVMADASEEIRGKIEARGVGLLRAPAAGPCALALVIDLDAPEAERLPPFRKTQVLEQTFPLIRKSGFSHFPAAILLYLKHGRWQ